MILFGDKSSFTSEKVPEMVWAKREMPLRTIGRTGKMGVSIFIFLNFTCEVYSVHGNIGQSEF